MLEYGGADWVNVPGGGGGGVTDHGALTGLADDDHGQYVLLAPAASARNTIAPAANVLALRIISADGDDASKNMIEAYNSGSAVPANFLFDIDAGGGSAWNLQDPIAVFEIDAKTGHTGRMFVAYSGDADQMSGFDKRARLFTEVTAVPADGDVATGMVYWYYDKTNGAAKLMWKGKTADGTVVTWEIPTGVIGLKSALDDHLADATDAHDASAISILDTASDFTATDVEGALAELQSDAEAHVAAADPHTGYVLESLVDAKGDLIAGSAADTVARLAAGTDFAASLVPDSSTATGLRWGTPRSGLRPTGSLYETISRGGGANIGGQTFLVSQRLGMVAIDLPLGLSIASISFMSGGTAAVTPTIQLFGLYDSGRALLRGSNDDGSTAWGSSTVKTLNLTSAFVTTYSGLHYLGILVVAGTVPNIHCAGINAVPASVPPITTGSSNTGVNALPNPANAIGALGLTPWAWVS